VVGEREQEVYRTYVVPQSFACRLCHYTATDRRVVEQHLRVSHPELFTERRAGAPPPPDGTAPGTGDDRQAPQRSPTSVPVVLYTDAGTWHNGTGRQHSVFAVWDGRTRSIVIEEDLPGTTNNEAEYAAIIAALELARQQNLRGVLIRSDSQLCVNQITGRWQVKEPRLRPLRERAAKLLREVQGRIEWVPRGQNQAGLYLEKKYIH
jgi:ribonuclease HI